MNSPLHTVDRLILGLGHFLADFVAPASTPRTEGAIGAAPFAVSPEGIAGRTRLGPDLAVLYRPGVVASVAVFSWGALSLLLGNVGERWAMIPTRDAELVRLEVRQQLESARLAEPRARWFAMVLGGAIVTLILSLGAGRLLGSGAAASFVLLLFGGATWLAANLLLLGSVRRIGDRLYRTSVTLEYGYPEKTRLLVALSDAPIAEQRQAATKLLQTLAERGASQWDYLDAQGGRGLGLSFGGGSAQVSGLLRRLVRPAIGLAIVWALFSFGPRIFRPITRGLANAWESMTSSAEAEETESTEGEDVDEDAEDSTEATASADPSDGFDTSPEWLRGEWVRVRSAEDWGSRPCEIEDRMTITAQSRIRSPSRRISGRGEGGPCDLSRGISPEPLREGRMDGAVFEWVVSEYESVCRFEPMGPSIVVTSCDSTEGIWTRPAPRGLIAPPASTPY